MIKSGAPPVLLEITGVPAAKDSSGVMPQGSNLDEKIEYVAHPTNLLGKKPLT